MMLATKFHNVPQEMRDYHQWIVWRAEGRNDLVAKVPYSVRDVYRAADITSPAAWATFDEAVACVGQGQADGIGFVFTEGDPFFGIDIDSEAKVTDPQALAARNAFLETLGQVRTYTERSPSGNGWHIIAKGQIPEGIKGRRSKAMQIEVYTAERYFTMTGDCHEVYPVTEQQELLDRLLANFKAPSVDRSLEVSDEYGRRIDLSDQEVIERAVSRNTHFAGMLYAQVGHMPGQWSDTFYQIVGDLDYITGDPEQVMRIVLNSPFVLAAPNAADGQTRVWKATRTFEATLRRVRSNPTHISQMYHTDHGRKLVAGLMRAKEERAQEVANEIKRKAAEIEQGLSSTARSVLGGFNLGPELLSLSVPPGIAGRYVEATMGAMRAPFLKFAIPSTLATLTGLLGRRWKLSTGEGLNINVILAAKTGTGKSQSTDAWDNFMYQAMATIQNNVSGQARSRVLATSTSSIQGIFPKFMECPSMVWFNNEAAGLLNALTNPKPSNVESQLKDAFNDLYDASRLGKRFSPPLSAANNRANLTPVENLNISTYWTLTDSKFDMYGSDAADGFLSRVIIVRHPGRGGVKNPNFGQHCRELAPDLLATLRTLLAIAKQYDDMFPGEAICMIDTSQVNQLAWSLDEVAEETKNKALDGDLPVHYAAVGRVTPVAFRIAGALAVMDNPHMPVIRDHHYRWAFGYVLQNLIALLSDMDQGEVGATMSHDMDVVIREMRKLIAKGRDVAGGIKQGELAHHLRHLKPFKDMPSPGEAARRVILEMVDNGQLEIGEGISDGTRGRPAKVVRLTREGNMK